MYSSLRTLIIFKLILILSLAIIFSGCATQHVDHEFTGALNENKEIGFITYESEHMGSSGALFTGALIGGVLGATMVAAIGEAVGSKEISYVEKLDLNCFISMEETLRDSPFFLLKYEKLDNVPDLLDPEREVDTTTMTDDQIERKKDEVESKNSYLIREFASSNNLDGALRIKVFYAADFYKITLNTQWFLYDENGETKVHVETDVSEKVDEGFPNTFDPKHEEIYNNLARRSTEKFLNILNGKEIS